jgi:RNA polymerase sigma-70 factor (sigma-E family)
VACGPRRDGVRPVREPDGFREFVLARYPALIRLGTLLTGDPGHGEDLVQASLVKTFRAWRRLHPDGDAEAYTRTVMARAAWKGSRRRWHGEVPTAELPEVAVESPYDGVDRADGVRRLLAALPEQQRVVLVLRFWSGLTESEIATALRCSPGTVKSRASRALDALRLHPDLRTVVDRSPTARPHGGTP